MAKIVMEPEKLVKSAKGIQRIVQEKLAERLRDEEKKAAEEVKEQERSKETEINNHTPPIEDK